MKSVSYQISLFQISLYVYNSLSLNRENATYFFYSLIIINLMKFDSNSIKININYLKEDSDLINILKCIIILKNKIISLNVLFKKLNIKINVKFYYLKV